MRGFGKRASPSYTSMKSETHKLVASRSIGSTRSKSKIAWSAIGKFHIAHGFERHAHQEIQVIPRRLEKHLNRRVAGNIVSRERERRARLAAAPEAQRRHETRQSCGAWTESVIAAHGC